MHTSLGPTTPVCHRMNDVLTLFEAHQQYDTGKIVLINVYSSRMRKFYLVDFVLVRGGLPAASI